MNQPSTDRVDPNEIIGLVRKELPALIAVVVRIWRKSRRRCLIEIEDAMGRRWIIKHGPTDKVSRGHRALEYLRTKGFAPPAHAAVCEPLHLLLDGRISIHEVAPGLDVHAALCSNAQPAHLLGSAAATWLAALHTVQPESLFGAVRRSQTRATPGLDARIGQLQEKVRGALETSNGGMRPTVWRHGDFHCEHIFVANSRVTAIDLDKFGCGERALDIGFFLGQTVAMGWDRFGSFTASAELRRAFLARYEALTQYANQPRIALHAASSILQAVQYRWRKRTLAPAFLDEALAVARRCLAGERLLDYG